MDNWYIDINVVNAYQNLGDYPGPNNRMSSCCLAMRTLMTDDDIM